MDNYNKKYFIDLLKFEEINNINVNSINYQSIKK